MPSPRKSAKAAGAALPGGDSAYRLLFERNPNPLWVAGVADLRMLAANEAALRLYGYTRDELLALTAVELRPPEEKERFLARIAELRASSDRSVMHQGVWTHRRKDGSTLPVRITSSRLEFEGTDSFLVMAEDMTHQLAAEKSLREKDRQLMVAQKMEAVGRLAGGVAHEFNNILTGIMGLSALIQQQLRPDDPASTDAASIITASKRAAGLVLRLLTFSRQGEADKRRVDLNDAVARNRAMASAVLGEKVRLDVEVSAEPLLVDADSSQLDQVLLNLALNARDAIAGEGRVRVSTAAVQLSQPLVTPHGTLAPGRYAALTLEDTGHGIPEEHRHRIFEPFFTTRGPGQGTGLGLSMAYAIARDHDGLLSFESSTGRGSTFKLLLPRAADGVPAAAPLAPKVSEARPPGSRGIILVADDEHLVRDSVARVLAPHGFKLLVAPDGEEAVRLLEGESGPIRLAILDVVMPKLDGLEAYERMRRSRPGLPVLFMSGYATARARDVIRRHGASFLPKPFLPRDLLARIDQILEARR
ncbi:MAG: response regulator [Elusimicrobia bacterium]|nr:response regulator [Elusimicrobiota bacterium]